MSELEQAIELAKAGDKVHARRLLKRVLQENPDSELAWGWLGNCALSEDERIHCLKQVVRINPENAKARAELEKSSEQKKKAQPIRTTMPVQPTPVLHRPTPPVGFSSGLPPDFLQELRRYRTRTPNVTCLQCGYTGPMGNEKRVIPWYSSWWLLAALVLIGLATWPASALRVPMIIFAPMYFFGVWGSFIALFVVPLTRFLLPAKHIVVCPNCKARLGPT